MALSVPSSSGSVSSTISVSTAAPARLWLSVPSSSGRSLQRRGLPSHGVRLHSFSPLFIGEVSSTGIADEQLHTQASLSVPSSSGMSLRLSPVTSRCHADIHLSVPSSSGKSLQRIHSHLKRCLLSRLSVPSSSGRSLRHFGQSSIASKVLSAFQSPLHRGCLFNGEPSCHDHCRAELSVPSSSGMSLQPGYPPRAVGKRIFSFSPLFIGEVSSTTARHRYRLHVPAFQSPLHRGSLFNTYAAFNGVMSRCNSFSPLFIGEVSSTDRGGRSEQGGVHSFQSPLHRGSLFDILQLPICSTLCQMHLSVPSSSGMSLQRAT